jgi:hypothetical protein
LPKSDGDYESPQGRSEEFELSRGHAESRHLENPSCAEPIKLGASSVGPQRLDRIDSGGAPCGERGRDDTDSQNQSGHCYKGR